jgi:leader peptidase (prepilin peptidase)/N-methyltransferase
MQTQLVNVLPLLAAPFIGSFLAALAYRLPRDLPFAGGRSRCDHCAATLGGVELVPIAGWLWCKGKCRHCGGAIAVDYVLLEMSALTLALWAWTVVDGWLLWATCGFGWVLLLSAAIDWRHMYLPDGLTLPLLLAGLVLTAWRDVDLLWAHGLGAVAGFAVFALTAWLYRKLREREGLGLGDAKLLAAVGAWVGWTGLPSTVLFAALAGIVAALARQRFSRSSTGREQPIPFGPFLGLGGWLVWLYGPLEISF